jgi:hypothetical protein
MGDTWITDLTHFLDQNGRIEPMPGPARLLAEHFTSIVLMASHAEDARSPEYQVRCRRRPARKRCPGYIEADMDSETDEIMWWCPMCGDNGYIRNWKGTIWDLSHDSDPK